MSYYGRCQTCGADLFERDIHRLVAFRRCLSNTIEVVDLKGRAPYSGVRLMCGSCLRFFCSVVIDRFQGENDHASPESS